MLKVLIWVLLASKVGGDIVGFDCGDSEAEYTKISLVDTKGCQDLRNSSTTLVQPIQLLQTRQYQKIHVFTCLLVTQVRIYHCGMFSHATPVRQNSAPEVIEVTKEDCMSTHRERSVRVPSLTSAVVIRPNSTSSTTSIIRGSLDQEGNCKGSTYVRDNIQYDNVFVELRITYTIHDYHATNDVSTNSVGLRSGIRCDLSEGSCFDPQLGLSVWEQHHYPGCDHTIDVLYEGTAEFNYLHDNPQKPRYIIVEADDTIFALHLKNQADLCGTEVYITDQYKLYVNLQARGKFRRIDSLRPQKNNDLMAQFLSKLLYIQIAVKKELSENVYDAIKKRCELRNDMLKNRLALARQNPGTVGKLIKQNLGYLGRVLGEVLFIVKCVPKIVQYRKTEMCFQELPVSYLNESKFLSPVTHIIQDVGTQIDCSNILPPNFQIDNVWVELTPTLRRTEPAIMLDPNDEEEDLSSMKMKPISSHGIFSMGDMRSFQRTLLFPTEVRAISTLISRRVTMTEDNRPDLRRLFTPDEFAGMATNTLGYLWNLLSELGNVFSVVMLLYSIIAAFNYTAGVVSDYRNLKAMSEEMPAQQRRRYLLSSVWPVAARHHLNSLFRRDQATQPQPLYPSVELEEVPEVIVHRPPQ